MFAGCTINSTWRVLMDINELACIVMFSVKGRLLGTAKGDVQYRQVVAVERRQEEDRLGLAIQGR